MVNTEKAFSLLPVVAILYDKLELDEYRKKVAQENKGKKGVSAELLGIDLFKYVLKNSAKIKEEVFEIVSIFEEKTVEEVKAQNFMLTINSLKAIFTDTETTDFLKQAMPSVTPEV